MILPAYAKLNLSLDVQGKRQDGMHEIASVMQTISLHDLLFVERSDCRAFIASGIQVEGENLVLKAARELEAYCGRTLPLHIRLHKRIPVGAGMGGGSADAAALLRAAVRVYGLSLTQSELQSVAALVGQDVPFLLSGGTALATGTGATVETLPSMHQPSVFLVLCPPVSISTRSVYEAFDGRPRSGARSAGLAEAIRGGGKVDPAQFGNDLEAAALALYPGLREWIDPVRQTMNGFNMTGTGAAFFKGFPSLEAARLAASELGNKQIDHRICRTVTGFA